LDPNRRQIPQWRIGCAGWAVASAHAASFPAGGSHLERYAQVFDAVEINSSFYRPHRPSTYARWADAVPRNFRFSVKMPRTLSHEKRLRGGEDELAAFLDQAGHLGGKLGCLLLQLPPSLAYEAVVAEDFFRRLRRRHAGPVACEPRHVTWFAASVQALLRGYGIARVGADPAVRPRAALPAGDRRIEYLRLHGSPRMYYDAYAEATLARLAGHLLRPRSSTQERWCVFDNTALGHATQDALALQTMLRTAAAEPGRA
jgi:uncharacterized protein YecE (DUF72 family)